MMRLRATVRTVSGRTTHLRGLHTPGGIEIARLPDPIAVEVVEEQDGAFFLLRLDRAGHCIADTWHETLETAKTQANFEFGVEEGDWKEE
jgi:hypothetical protein